MNKYPKDSLADILQNPSEYPQDGVDFAKFMKNKFDKAGEVKYDKEGMETVAEWVSEYLKEV